MKTKVFFLMALLLVCGALYAQTPDSVDSVRVEMVLDTIASASTDTVETVAHHSLWMGVPTEESSQTYQSPNLRYTNPNQVGNVSYERHDGNTKPSAEPNIPMTLPDGRTVNINGNAGAGFSIGWGK